MGTESRANTKNTRAASFFIFLKIHIDIWPKICYSLIVPRQSRRAAAKHKERKKRMNNKEQAAKEQAAKKDTEAKAPSLKLSDAATEALRNAFTIGPNSKYTIYLRTK